MTKTVCDFCNEIILNKEGTVFYYAKKKCRIAILEISVTRGVRWKEMDACSKCVKRFSAENCGDVQINNGAEPAEICPVCDGDKRISDTDNGGTKPCPHCCGEGKLRHY
jgi:hypothetical protein